jgi:hypothetical protein
MPWAFANPLGGNPLGGKSAGRASAGETPRIWPVTALFKLAAGAAACSRDALPRVQRY